MRRNPAVDEELVVEVAKVLWQYHLQGAVERLQNDGLQVAMYDSHGFVADRQDEPPRETFAEAADMVREVEAQHAKSIVQVLEELGDPDLAEVGYYIAMQSLGTGVSWGDDHDGKIRTGYNDADRTSMLADEAAQEHFGTPEVEIESFDDLYQDDIDTMQSHRKSKGWSLKQTPIPIDAVRAVAERVYTTMAERTGYEGLRVFDMDQAMFREHAMVLTMTALYQATRREVPVLVGELDDAGHAYAWHIAEPADGVFRSFPDEESAREAQVAGEDVAPPAKVAGQKPKDVVLTPRAAGDAPRPATIVKAIPSGVKIPHL